jgi:hypothetical protein
MTARIEALARPEGGWTVRVVRGRRTVWRREAGTMAELRRALDEAARRRRG